MWHASAVQGRAALTHAEQRRLVGDDAAHHIRIADSLVTDLPAPSGAGQCGRVGLSSIRATERHTRRVSLVRGARPDTGELRREFPVPHSRRFRIPTPSSPLRPYLLLLRRPGVAGPAAGAALASLPIGMAGLAVLLLLRQSNADFTTAGLVVGPMGAGTAAGMVAQGRLIDRFGQPRVLVAAAAAQAAGLTGLVYAVPAGAPVWLLGILAFVGGAGEPQIGASLRALWPGLVPVGQRGTATALSSLLFEGPVLLGPLLVVGLLAVTGPGPVVLLCSGCFTLGTAVLVTSPASRAWRGVTGLANPRVLGALTAPGIRTTTAVAAAQGLVTGMVQVGVVGFATGRDSPAAAGLLYSALSLGSLIGTAGWGARAWRWGPDRRLPALLAAAAAAAGVCAAARDVPALAVTLLLLGACLGPVAVSCFELVDHLAPPGTIVEGFTTTTAAGLLGLALGMTVGGAVVDRAGPDQAFLTAAAVAATSCLIVLARRPTLPTTLTAVRE